MLRPKHADRLATFLCSGLRSIPHNILNHGPYWSFVAVSPLESLSPYLTPQTKMAFLSFAANQLPELKQLLHTAIPNFDGAEASKIEFSSLLADICPCSHCSTGTGRDIDTICLQRVGSQYSDSCGFSPGATLTKQSDLRPVGFLCYITLTRTEMMIPPHYEIECRNAA